MSVDSWREILIVSAMYIRECAKTNMGTNTFEREREREKKDHNKEWKARRERSLMNQMDITLLMMTFIFLLIKRSYFFNHTHK